MAAEGMVMSPHSTEVSAAQRDDPRARFPAHIAALSAHLADGGDHLGHWTILHAAETRLDEDGMEVELVLLRRSPASGLRTYHITVCQGRVSAIRMAIGGPAPTTPLRNPLLPQR